MKPICLECPFQKVSAPGWLGDYKSFEEIAAFLNADVDYPCHMEMMHLIEQKSMSLEDAADSAHHCTGALIFMNNSFKISRNRRIAAMQKEAGMSELIFKNVMEGTAHHTRMKKNAKANRVSSRTVPLRKGK